jgi:hypothetical protein
MAAALPLALVGGSRCAVALPLACCLRTVDGALKLRELRIDPQDLVEAIERGSEVGMGSVRADVVEAGGGSLAGLISRARRRPCTT